MSPPSAAEERLDDVRVQLEGLHAEERRLLAVLSHCCGSQEHGCCDLQQRCCCVHNPTDHKAVGLASASSSATQTHTPACWLDTIGSPALLTPSRWVGSAPCILQAPLSVLPTGGFPPSCRLRTAVSSPGDFVKLSLQVAGLWDKVGPSMERKHRSFYSHEDDAA